MLYVQVIYDCIRDLSDVEDNDTAPNHAEKFYKGTGMWSNPADIEAIAQNIVCCAERIHVQGAAGTHLGAVLRSTKLHERDVTATFIERIYFMAILLRHSKFFADQVMRQFCIEQYLVRIWSTLMEQPWFTEILCKMTPSGLRRFLTEAAYSMVGATPPSDIERTSWYARLQRNTHVSQQPQQQAFDMSQNSQQSNYRSNKDHYLPSEFPAPETTISAAISGGQSTFDYCSADIDCCNEINQTLNNPEVFGCFDADMSPGTLQKWKEMNDYFQINQATDYVSSGFPAIDVYLDYTAEARSSEG